ncbi:MAG: hypothetical protein QW594_01880, partial [Candidatus Woesearchaeota archaeon]
TKANPARAFFKDKTGSHGAHGAILSMTPPRILKTTTAKSNGFTARSFHKTKEKTRPKLKGS